MNQLSAAKKREKMGITKHEFYIHCESEKNKTLYSCR